MRQKFPYILLIVIFIIGTFLILFGQPTIAPQNFQSKRTPTPTYVPPNIPQTSLWLEPNPVSINNQGNVFFEMYINAKENKVKSVQLEISYDPTKLKFVSIKGIELLAGKQIFINKIDEVKGRISYGLENIPGKNQPPIEGADVMGELEFKPLVSDGSTTTVSILPDSVVMGYGVDKSVLVNTKSAIVTLAKRKMK